ncbi:MAG: amidohydrolase [Blastopirellula sp.]|nr:MAG: amidohydrolase [Blastopirellula sp.]
MNINRRNFVKTVAGSTLAMIAPQTLTAKEKKMPLPIIDTHQHLWDLSKFTPPWLATAPDVISSTHVTQNYLEATKGLNVVKAVYMEIDVAPKQHVAEAQHVIALSKSEDHPTVAAVISGRPNSAGFAAYIEQFKESPYIKGVRQVMHVPTAPQGMCLEPQYVKSAQLLGELGMSMDLCMRPEELGDGAKLASLCKGTRFIVDHCGNADPKAFLPDSKRDGEAPWHSVDAWKRGIEDLAKQDNVVCKISGVIARVPKTGWKPEMLAPIVNHCLDSFGPDRVMFGGDWPVCKIGGSFAEWVNALKQIVGNRSIEAQKKLFHDNAEKFYGIA